MIDAVWTLLVLLAFWLGYWRGLRVGRRRETKEWFDNLSIDKPSPTEQRWHQQALRAEGTRWRIIDKET